jgi:hypothetical protein
MRTLLLTAIAIIFLFTLNSCDSTKEAQIERTGWEKVFENKKYKISLDFSRIEKLPDNHYKIPYAYQSKGLIDKAGEKVRKKEPPIFFKNIETYYEFNCDNKKYKPLASKLFYSKTGEWRSIIPETAAESMFALVCNNYRGNWEEIGVENKPNYYLDWSSLIKLPDNHYKIWVKIITKTLGNIIYYIEYDCVNKKERYIIEGLDKDNKMAFHIPPLLWHDLPEPSAFMETVCSKQSKGIEKTK